MCVFALCKCKESDYVIGGSTKIIQHWIKNICYIKAVACSLNLAPEMSFIKKRIDTRRAVCFIDSYAACPVLMTIKILRFYPKQGSSTPSRTISVSRTRDLAPKARFMQLDQQAKQDS